MSKSFNFNAMSQQTLEVILSETENVVLHVTTPPEYLIEKLSASAEDLAEMGDKQSIEKAQASYALIAALISCNLEGVTVTADDLRVKYKIAPLVLAAFTTAYMDFINDFHTAKN